MANEAAPAADALPVVHIVDPENPRLPADDSKNTYLWAPMFDDDWSRVNDMVRWGYSYTCKGPDGNHWWRKPTKGWMQCASTKANPLQPDDDVDDLFQWAAIEHGSNEQQRLLAENFSFASYVPSSSLLMFRKRRVVAEPANNNDDDDNDGAQSPKRARHD